MNQITKLVAFAVVSGMVITGCKQSGNMEKTTSGLEYKIEGSQSGKSITDSSSLELHYSEMTEKDSMISSTKDPKMNPGGKPVTISMKDAQLPKHIKEALKLMHEGDSGMFLYPTDSLFKGAKPEQIPPYMKKGTKAKFQLIVKKILTESELEAKMKEMRMERAKQMAMQREAYIGKIKSEYGEQAKKDDDAVAKYIKDKKLTATATKSGLYYVIETEGTDPVIPGSKLKVNYAGYLLNGKLFDTSVEEVAKKENAVQPGRPYSPFEVTIGVGQVIPGWDEGMTYFKKGGKGKLIIPSYLAYGKDGQGQIPAYACLVFDVEILDVQ